MAEHFTENMNAKELTITKKIRLAEGVYVLELAMPEPLPFIPGQFVVLMVAPKVFRSYSLVEVKDTTMTLLVDVRVGGPASQFFEGCEPGDTLQLIGKALGKFTVKESDRPKVFIATGTGLAPFIPMAKHLLDQDPSADVKLFFGSRFAQEAYCASFFAEYLDSEKHPNFQIINCISRPEGELQEGSFEGRVTTVVPSQLEECGSQDFYLCGNPQMVDDIQAILKEKGATDNIHTEKYA